MSTDASVSMSAYSLDQQPKSSKANGNAFVIPSRHINQARFLWSEFACVAPEDST
ncbi:hypothetical protein [Rhodopirellula baltica]